jgi:hypothetical protein
VPELTWSPFYRICSQLWQLPCCQSVWTKINIYVINRLSIKHLFRPDDSTYFSLFTGQVDQILNEHNASWRYCPTDFSLWWITHLCVQQWRFPEEARHTPYSFWGQTIAIRYHKVYIFEHVWTQGIIIGRFQGNLHALVPIGGATFDTAQSPALGNVWIVENAPQVHWTIFRERTFLHTYCKHHAMSRYILFQYLMNK